MEGTNQEEEEEEDYVRVQTVFGIKLNIKPRPEATIVSKSLKTVDIRLSPILVMVL